MAYIEKRTSKEGDTSYRVQIRLKGHPQATASFERLTDAKRWASQTETAIREGRYFPSTAIKSKTLTDAIERYRNEQLPELKDYEGRWRLLQWWLKHYETFARNKVDFKSKIRYEFGII